MKNNISVLKSRYGSTDVVEEFLRYPFESPIAYDYDYSGTYSKYSIVDKYYVDSLIKPYKRLISGGAEWNLSGLSMTFSVSDLYYTFAGEILSYSASYPGLTFDAGETNPRIDAIVINEDKTLSIIKGVASANPARPVISESQILIQYAYIDASSTSIGASENVYLNGSQWTVTPYQLSGIQSGSYNSEFTGDTFDASTKCVELNTDFRTGVKFKKPSSGLDATKYGSLSMRFKFTDKVPDNKSLFAQIQGTANGASVYGNTLNLMSYGLQRDVVNTWQHIVVPTSKFGNNIATYDVLTLRMAGGASGSNTLWRVDSILFQKGINFDGYMGEPDATGGGSGIGGLNPAVGGGVIGPAEAGDGTYTDGVFTDFNENTTIGTAVDRFNELFLSLVPSPAPILTKWSASRSNGVSGKLSFGTTDQTIDATTYYAANSTNGANPVVGADGLWSPNNNRLSIYAAGSVNTSDFTGVLANGEPADLGVPFAAYPANSFREAKIGTLTLTINGTIVSTATANLTNSGAIDTTNGNTTSGFILSAATQSRFSGGKYFETDNPLFSSRTGTWVVKANDSRIRNGYNYITVEHKSTSVNVFTRTLSRFEFIQDSNVNATSYSEFGITSYSLTGTKYLSGINYYTGGTIYYDGTMSNLYRNTYSSASDAVSIVENGADAILNLTGKQYTLNANGGIPTKTVKLSEFNSGNPISITLNTSSKRRLNQSISLQTTTKRTLQGTTTGGLQTIANVLLDNYGITSTNNLENFDDEAKRLISGNYATVTDITSGTWTSTESLNTGNSGHNTGLQVYGGQLVYPKINFSTIGVSSTNLNFGIAATDYSALTGNRTYYRYFYNASFYSFFSIVITGSNTTFVAKTTTLSGNNAWVEIKLPNGTGTGTGWMDCYSNFTGAVTDGSGAWAASYGSAPTQNQRALGGTWGLSTGTTKTVNSNGYVVVRITTSATWTGNLESITFNFLG